MLAPILTAALIGLLIKQSMNTQPSEFTNVSGTIRPGKLSAIFTVTGGVVFAATGIAATLSNELVLGVLIFAFGAAIAGFMAPSLGSWHDVNWGLEGVNGASKMFGPSLGRSRTTIKWQEISTSGVTATQYWYIESTDGRRVYWSYLYRGHAKFRDEIQARRPDIPLPY